MTRKNLILNPSGEVALSPWVGVNASLNVVSNEAYVGTKSIKMTASGTGRARAEYGMVAVEAGKTYTLSGYYKVLNTLSNNYYTVVEFYDNSTNWTYMGEAGSTSGEIRNVTNGWVRRSVTFTVPAGATMAYIHAPLATWNTTSPSTDVIYVDALMLEEGALLNDYFDGDTAGYAWDGSPHASTSSTLQTFPDVKAGPSELRLEVQAPNEGLPNLIENPSGDLGSWGWVTPLPDTNLYTTTGDDNGTALEFYVSYAQPVHFTSEPMPVAAGRFVGGRFDIAYGGSSVDGKHLKARFEFLDANRTLLSSSPQTGAAFAYNTTYYIDAVQAPAGTAYVRLRFDMYDGTSNPAADTWIAIRRAMVTDTATVAEMGSTARTNLVPNPSFETNMTGWTNGRAPDVTMTRTNVTAVQGSFSVKLQQTGADASFINFYTTGAGTSAIPVEGGADYNLSWYLRVQNADLSKRKARAYPVWYTSGGAFIASIKQDHTTPLALGSFTRLNLTYTAPSNAAYMRVALEYHATTGLLTNTEYIYIDGVMVEKATEMGTYIEGTVATGTGYAFEAPYDWRNILGATNNIKFSKNGLDVGLLSATILDPMFDPSVAEWVRPGKRVRLRTLVDGVWEDLFTGKLNNAQVKYDKDKSAGAEVVTRIEVTASDNITQLANQGENRGVASIGDLPVLLEGKGVPWNINGSGNQKASATVVSYNENASVLDQIAITRDTALGYAWVDRHNIIQVWDQAQLPSTPMYTFSDVQSNDPTWTSYSNIDVDFNTDRVINDVTVNWLRYDIGNDSTSEVPYGPYRDVASVATWGARSATFTIQGATENATEIGNYAQAVLAANGTPEIRANSLVMPVRNDKERAIAAKLDLFMPVAVKYDTKVDKALRITGMEHTITPDKWLVSLTFDVQDSVAAPTWTPSPPFKGLSDEGSATSGVVQMFAGEAPPTGWLLCAGQSLSTTAYPGLFSAIGYNFGGSGGSFNLPNMTQHFPVGGAGGDVGNKGGSKKIVTANLPAHSHTFSGTTANDGLHSHIVTRRANSGTVDGTYSGGGATNTTNNRTNDDGVHNHSFSGTTNNTGSGTDYMPPYVTLNFIIKV